MSPEDEQQQKIEAIQARLAKQEGRGGERPNQSANR